MELLAESSVHAVVNAFFILDTVVWGTADVASMDNWENLKVGK